MDSDLQWQIDHLEQQFRDIEPRSRVHPEARELCAEALAWHLPQLRELSMAGNSENTTVALLDAWDIHKLVRSRIAEAEKIQHLIDEALSRAVAAYAA